MKILVLGSGLVGAPMAADLAKNGEFEVTVADISKTSLNRLNNESGIKKVVADLSDRQTVLRLASEADYVLSAVPGFMGFETLKTVIEAGKNAIDIAFFPEDAFELDTLAKEKGLTVITDCGVAPGMSNILTGYVHHLLEHTETALTYVGGLPVVREWPYEYKAVFSPADVIEEYTRPARYIENGVMVTKPALSDPEYLNFPGTGTLEAFNSDGIRSLAKTIRADNIKEKTLRYPGHIALMAVLRDTGFFSKEPVEINGTSVRPLDFTSRLLFPKWELKPGEEDITVMKVIVEGIRDGKRLRYTYDLYDRFDKVSGVHSMARTTGYTATVAMRMLTKGLYSQAGISVPEYIGEYEECVKFLLEGLAVRGVNYELSIESL